MPRLITDNVGQYVSAQFRAYLRERDVSYSQMVTGSRVRPGLSQSNGKVERFHKSLNGECVRVTTMVGLGEAWRLIGKYVQECNARRLYGALHSCTPTDYLQGDAHVQSRLHKCKLAMVDVAQSRRAYWKTVIHFEFWAMIPTN